MNGYSVNRFVSETLTASQETPEQYAAIVRG
jgi:hypothetical protein